MYYVGIDLGGTKIAAGLVNDEGIIIYKESIATGRERSQNDILKDIALLAKRIIENSGVNLKEIKSIGVGSPGIPNSKEGILVYTNNLNFRNAPIRTTVQSFIDLPIYLDNDANCAALAEGTVGAARDAEYSITITLGTGVGGGIIINRKIYSGFNFAGAELGHMCIVVDGEYCTCGRNGCWEAYASATALTRQTRDAAKSNPSSLINDIISDDFEKIDAKTAFDAARMGDNIAEKVVNNYLKYLAEGIVNIVNIFQPEVIVVGGGVSKEGENLLKPLRELVIKSSYTKDYVPQTRIVEARMGNDAGIIGAAMLGKM